SAGGDGIGDGGRRRHTQGRHAQRPKDPLRHFNQRCRYSPRLTTHRAQ
ncbi:unnamed protein product, partial [Musa acuminata subsp. burmannicoides]